MQQMACLLTVVGLTIVAAALPARLKTRWATFVQEHREDLKSGHRFKPGEDTELTPDLMPPEYKISLQNNKDWP